MATPGKAGKLMENVLCPVCQADETSLAYEVTDLAYGTPGLFKIVRCKECHTLYQNPRPTEDEIGNYYPKGYEPFNRGIAKRQGIREWIFHQRMRPRCLQVSRLVSSGRLLDVGCSNGLFLNELKRYGDWAVYGIEPNPGAARYAKERLGLDVFSSLDEAGFPDAFFDIVTMWDVIEHLHHPDKSLVQIARILKPDGTLIIGTPNAASLEARFFGRFWKGLDPPRHLVIFERSTMQHLLRRCGFRLERVYSFYGRYTATANSLRLWLQSLKLCAPIKQLSVRIIFFPLWRWLTLPAYWLIEVCGYGSILTYQARPSVDSLDSQKV